jgi:hypothetical protein
MQIGELAKRTALMVDAIRFYGKRRLLPKPAPGSDSLKQAWSAWMENVATFS